MNLAPSIAPSLRYIIISPVKDEERYVELTLSSVIRQTLKPILWIIVDDGSNDQTPDIVNKYAKDHSFIRLVHNPNTGPRKPGPSVIRAFNIGYQSLGGIDYDFIVKLDCDISFEPDYFQKLLGRLNEDQLIGIASGVYLEMDKTADWREIVMPSYHAAGACKVMRRKCFEEIEGFIVSAGWDTVDEIRAMARGWRTTHFTYLRMRHHKPEGSGIGAIRTSQMHGEIYYLTGGGKLFLLLKLIHRITTKPYLLSALALSWGYMRAVLMQKQRLVTKEEARIYQAKLHERLWAQAMALLRLS